MNRREFLRLSFGAVMAMPCGWLLGGPQRASRLRNNGDTAVHPDALSIPQASLGGDVGGVPAAVLRAVVVITDPNHLAVALEYEDEGFEAPRVVAKGAGYLAERIRDLAAGHRIPVVQKPDLARVLYGSVETGKTIPVELYKKVADVLAYVYRITGRTVPV